MNVIDMYRNLLVLVAVFLSAALFSAAADAAPVAGNSNAVEQVFCNAVLMLTGTTGKAIATVAVGDLGYFAFVGKLSWGMALIVTLGVALMFGGASIVVALGGTGNACTAGSVLTT